MNIEFQNPLIWSDPQIRIEIGDCEDANIIVELFRAQAKEAVCADMWDDALKYILAARDLEEAVAERKLWEAREAEA